MNEGWNRVTAAKGSVMRGSADDPSPPRVLWAYSDRALADIAIVNEVLERRGIHNFDVAAEVVGALYSEQRLGGQGDQ